MKANNQYHNLEADFESMLQHLQLLGYKDGDRVFLRTISLEGISKNIDFIYPKLPSLPADRNCYVVVNGHGHRDKDVTHGRAVFIEHDDRPREEQIDLWKDYNLPEPTFQLDTGGKSIHSYWVFDEPIPVKDWIPLQAALLTYTKADQSIKNPSRVMRLSGSIHQKTQKMAVLVSVVGRRTTLEEMRSLVPSQKTQERPAIEKATRSVSSIQLERFPLIKILAKGHRDLVESGCGEGSRNSTGAAIARDLIGCESWLQTSGIDFEGTALGLFDQYCDRCTPPLREREKETIWRSAQKENSKPCLSEEKLLNCIEAHQKSCDRSRQNNNGDRSNGSSSTASNPKNESTESEDDPLTKEDVQSVFSEANSKPSLEFIHPYLVNPLRRKAQLLNIPPECLIGAILPVAASLLKVGTRLALSPATDWYATPIIWTSLVGESGTSKSPCWETATLPLQEVQSEWDQRYQCEYEEYEAALEAWEKDKGKDDRGSKPKEPFARDLYFQDATLEAIVYSISKHPENGTICAVDELTQFSKGFDAYRGGRGGDRSKWLSAYDGKGMKVDRKGSPRISVPRSSISLSGNTQPAILQKEMGDLQVIDGFWQRFMFFPLPLAKANFPGEGGTCNLSGLLASAYQQLDRFPALEITLSPEAKKVWRPWFEECEEGMIQEMHPAIRALYPKAKERAARVALVVHFLNLAIEGVDFLDPEQKKISAQTMEGAIALTKWTLAQTRLLFSDFGLGENPKAVKILRFVNRFSGLGWITARQVCRWNHPPLSAPLARQFMAQVAALGYAVSNGEDPSSKTFKIQIVTDKPDKPNQTLAQQGITGTDKLTDKALTSTDKALTNFGDPLPDQGGKTSFVSALSGTCQ